jgi:hypothetical protein
VRSCLVRETDACADIEDADRRAPLGVIYVVGAPAAFQDVLLKRGELP